MNIGRTAYELWHAIMRRDAHALAGPSQKIARIEKELHAAWKHGYTSALADVRRLAPEPYCGPRVVRAENEAENAK